MRHARSKQNIGETEELDEGLSDFGKQQAIIVARFIKRGLVKYMGHEFDMSKAKAFVSPFLRILETVRPLQQAFPSLEVTVCGDLGEYVNHYDYPELKVPNRKHLFPSYNWDSYQEETYNQKHHTDSWHLERLYNFYESLPTATPSIVVSHGFPCLTINNVAIGNVSRVPRWDFSINNASISWVKHGEALWWGRNLYHEVENIAEFNEK